jgi:Ca-activated chloride channel family protein
MMKRFFPLACVALVGLTSCDPPPQGPQRPGSQASTTTSAAEGAKAQPAVPPPGAVQSLQKNFYLVFDGSGSMEGDRIRSAKMAAIELVNKLPEEVAIGLYAFDAEGEGERVPLGLNNRVAILKAIKNLAASGGTPLGRACVQGTETLVGKRAMQLGYGEFRLIVLTDGESSDSLRPFTRKMQRLLDQGESIPLYTIGFQLAGDHALRQWSVFYQNAQNLEELKKALADATAELESFDPVK